MEARAIIETGSAGIDRIRVNPTKEGLALLRRLLPLVPDLDRCSQGRRRSEGRRTHSHAETVD